LRDEAHDPAESVREHAHLEHPTIGRISAGGLTCYEHARFDHPGDIGGKIEQGARLECRGGRFAKRLA
jgi:hypothetical protein